MLQEKEVMQLLEETEAVLHGHFLLTSGLHSPMYVEKFNVLQHPKYTEKLCQELAERYAADNVELVVGPMTGGILLAHEVGKALDTRAIFTERENGKMTLKRGFEIPKGTRVLIVEDIVTTGGSVMEVLDVEALKNVINNPAWKDNLYANVPSYNKELAAMMTDESAKFLLGTESLDNVIDSMMKNGTQMMKDKAGK